MAVDKEQYKICKKRGHFNSSVVLTSNPVTYTCKRCGVQYREEEKIVEINPPMEEGK